MVGAAQRAFAQGRFYDEHGRSRWREAYTAITTAFTAATSPADRFDMKTCSTDHGLQALSTMLETFPDAVVVFYPVDSGNEFIVDFSIALINPAATRCALLCHAKRGDRLSDIVTASNHKRMSENLLSLSRGAPFVDFELSHEFDQTTVWYGFVAVPIDGGIATRFIDITSRKKLEETARNSEERLRHLIDAVKDYALFMLDPHGIVVSWNTGAERLKGYKPDEIIGKHFSCFYPAVAREAGHPELELRIATETGRYEEEGLRIRKDGTSFLAHVVISSIREESGALRGFAKVTRDITVQQQLQGAIRDQARILDLAGETIFVRDSEDRIVYWNDGAQRAYGWSASDAVGQITHELLHTQFPEPLATISAHLRTTGRWEGELQHSRRDGSTLTVASRWTLQRSDNGHADKTIEINHDITARKRLELDLQIKNGQLLNALQAKDNFLGNMSHELRTPLNAIIGFTELMADGAPGTVSAEQGDYLRDILASARHLLQLINDLLDLTKIGAGQMRITPSSFSVAQAISSVCSVLRPLVQERRLRLKQELSHAPIEVTLDEKRFTQILYNLLSNAIKFTLPGGDIEISVAPAVHDKFQVAVRDTGIGIAAADFKKLFRDFQQIDSELSRRCQGTGLGLALTRKLVELQHGHIAVESMPGKGSTFSVTLPLNAFAT
jgi:PAS domain S-box-containing protein